jgi:glycosyltransferase involved in cell wall biosynthesis
MTRISVVIPTRNRRELLERCLASLERQTLEAADYEIIVVDDGSTDGTAEMLRTRSSSDRVRSVRMEHGGLSAARNRGNREARGEIVLCLDDDMLADPQLLEAHLAAHEGSRKRLVQGALRIADSVPRTPFVAYQNRLLESLHRRKSACVVLDGEDVSGGNISLRRELLDAVGGFEERLKGLRNTDGELAWRLERRGVEILYAAQASAAMTHVQELDSALHASFLYGRSYVFMQSVHPETRWKHSPLIHDRCSRLRQVMRRAVFLRGGLPARVCSKLLRAAIGIAQPIAPRSLVFALYRLALDGRFWQGVEAESHGAIRAFIPLSLPILCYHQVSDRKVPRFRRYVLPVSRFERQIRALARRGYRAVTLDALHAYLTRGEPLPPKPVVISFDDGYAELERTATPVLAEVGFPHVYFVNGGKIGGVTDWIKDAPDLEIMDAEQIARLARAPHGLVDFQAHSRGHLRLDRLDANAVRQEVQHDLDELPSLTGRPVRYLAYPYGAHVDATCDAVREMPIRCSFTVDQGLCRPGLDLQRLPRVEIFTNDLPFEFWFKIAFGYGPVARLRRRVKRLIRRLRGRPTRN